MLNFRANVYNSKMKIIGPKKDDVKETTIEETEEVLWHVAIHLHLEK